MGAFGPGVSVWAPFTITCYRDDDRFEREALGALTNLTRAGRSRLTNSGSSPARNACSGLVRHSRANRGTTATTLPAASCIATLFILARVDRARWEATR